MSLTEVKADLGEEIGYMSYNKTVLVAWSLLLVIPFIILFLLFFPLTAYLSQNEEVYHLSPIWFLIDMVVGTILIAILHETAHGKMAEYLASDIEVSYGFKMMYRVVPAFYTNFSGFLYRNQFIVIAMAPLFIITPLFFFIFVIFALIGTSWAIIAAAIFYLANVVNIVGAGGDLLLLWMLLKFPNTTIVQNKEEDLYGAVFWTSSKSESSVEELKKVIANQDLSSRAEQSLIFIINWFLSLVTVNGLMLNLMWNYIPSEEGKVTFLAWSAYFERLENGELGGFTFGTEISNFPLMLGIVTLVAILFHLITILIINYKRKRDVLKAGDRWLNDESTINKIDEKKEI